MIKKLYSALFADDDITFFDRDSGNVIFLSDEMVILSVNINNINLNDVNFYEDDPKTIIHIGVLAWHYRYKQIKHLKKK